MHACMDAWMYGCMYACMYVYTQHGYLSSEAVSGLYNQS